MASMNAFNATKVPPASSFEVLPPGDYIAMITDSENAITRKGGEMLKLTVTIIEGEHKDRKVWANLNLINDNPKAVEIAQRELSAICHATGVMMLTDSAQLHNRPLVVRLNAVHDPQWGDRNEVKGWKAVEKTAPLSPPTFHQPSTASAGSSGPKPWDIQTGGKTDTGVLGADGKPIYTDDIPY
jgi:hypothetical protein